MSRFSTVSVFAPESSPGVVFSEVWALEVLAVVYVYSPLLILISWFGSRFVVDEREVLGMQFSLYPCCVWGT